MLAFDALNPERCAEFEALSLRRGILVLYNFHFFVLFLKAEVVNVTLIICTWTCPTGLLVGIGGSRTIRLRPSLTFSDKNADVLLDILENVTKEMNQTPSAAQGTSSWSELQLLQSLLNEFMNFTENKQNDSVVYYNLRSFNQSSNYLISSPITSIVQVRVYLVIKYWNT